MRIIQIVLFSAGVLSFLISALFIGQVTGDVLWRAGIAVILVDMACAGLWPFSKNADRF